MTDLWYNDGADKIVIRLHAGSAELGMGPTYADALASFEALPGIGDMKAIFRQAEHRGWLDRMKLRLDDGPETNH